MIIKSVLRYSVIYSLPLAAQHPSNLKVVAGSATRQDFVVFVQDGQLGQLADVLGDVVARVP